MIHRARIELGLLVVAVALATWFTIVAIGFLPSLDIARPGLAEVPRWSSNAQPRLAQRVILVIIDGLRVDASREMPFLESLRAKGASGRARAEFPTLSLPGYTTILTGVSPRDSGVRTNEWSGRLAVDSLVDRVTAVGGRAAFASDRASLQPMFGPTWARQIVAVDDRTEQLIVLVPSTLDRAGHDHGGASQEYRETAHAIDNALGATLASVDLSRDAIVVVADHGHTDRGGHGGDGEEVAEVPLIFAGAGIRRGTSFGDVALVDVAPTIAVLLGIPCPGHSSGKTVVAALALEDSALRALGTSEAARLAYLAPYRSSLELAAQHRATVARWVRGPCAVAVLLAMAVAIVFGARRRWIAIGREAAVVAVFPAVFAVAVIALPLPLSPPHVPGDRLSFILEVSAYLGIALAAQLLAGWAVARRRLTRDGLAGVISVGLVVAAVPALVSWALVGQPGADLLPGPFAVMTTPVTAAAASCQAWLAAVVLAIGMLWRKRPADS